MKFNVQDPTNPDAFNRPPNQHEVGLRFAPLREMITKHKSTIEQGAKHGKALSYVQTIGNLPAQDGETFILRWEQMICQMSMNMTNLLNVHRSDIHVTPGCAWDKKEREWSAHTTQCVDIEIVNARLDQDDNEFYDYYDSTYATPVKDGNGSIILNKWDSLHYAGIREAQHKNLDYAFEILSRSDELPINYVFISKYGPLKKTNVSYEGSVIVLKIGVPGHYTMALVYIKENRIEFFDSGGTYDTIGWDGEDPNRPFSQTLRTRRALRNQSEHQHCISEYETNINDFIICNTLTGLFPEFEIVGINPGVDLQLDLRDAYCQTWIWLYIYMKFIEPRWPTRSIVKFLHSSVKTGSKSAKIAEDALLLIESFWKYIIYLGVDGASEEPFH